MLIRKFSHANWGRKEKEDLSKRSKVGWFPQGAHCAEKLAARFTQDGVPSALTATTCCTYCGIHEVSTCRPLACQPQARLDSKEKVLFAFFLFFSPKGGTRNSAVFFLPCLEEEEEKAAAERGEGQRFAIDSCRTFCGKWIGTLMVYQQQVRNQRVLRGEGHRKFAKMLAVGFLLLSLIGWHSCPQSRAGAFLNHLQFLVAFTRGSESWPGVTYI